MNKSIKITLLPENIECIEKPRTPLTKIIDKYNLPVYQPCGGNATCGKCIIRFLDGAPDPTYNDRLYLTPNELSQGYRLACQCLLKNDARIEISELSETMEIMAGVSARIELKNPLIYHKNLNIKPPDLESLLSDEELLHETLDPETIIPEYILYKLPEMLRNSDFKLTGILSKDRILDIAGRTDTVEIMGIALDVGSTTLAVSMIDLVSGKTRAIDIAINPQSKYGDDLITRLNYIIKNPGAEIKLRDILLAKINSIFQKIFNANQIKPENVYACIVSGNTIMNHLFLGINPKYIGLAPFTPVFRQMKETTAARVGLDIHPGADVRIMPNIGGFVGGDIISDMLCAGFGNQDDRIKLLIDIGTNCEVVLEHPNGRLAASSPAGPALEGACIRFGMRAESGAIYDIDDFDNFITIKNKPVRGICGSGLFHLIEAFYRKGAINLTGLITNDKNDLKFPVREFESDMSFELTAVKTKSGRDVYLTQSDIREFQLARSAIIAAWKMLCELAGIQSSDIEEVYIAGAFGNFIRPDAAISLGLVPLKDMNKIHFIGNASLEGCRLILTNSDLLDRAGELASTTQFVELAGKPQFQDVYVDSINFPG
jgi:uncharacterized 2Fe-2S/4Fe-4S cluster protein (DUF4445 family)